MKIGSFLTAALVMIVSCGAKNQSDDTSALKDENEIKVICDASNLPEGWVIVSHSNSINCRSMRDWNAYGVKKAGAREVVCADSPIPRGYVKNGTRPSVACGSTFRDNAYSIERL